MKYFPNKLGRPPAVNNPDCETFHPRYTTTIGFIFATFFSYFGYINPIYRTNRGDFTLTRCCAVIFLIFVPAQPMPGICAYFIGTTVKSGQPNILDLRRRPPCRSNRYSSPRLGIKQPQAGDFKFCPICGTKLGRAFRAGKERRHVPIAGSSNFETHSRASLSSLKRMARCCWENARAVMEMESGAYPKGLSSRLIWTSPASGAGNRASPI